VSSCGDAPGRGSEEAGMSKKARAAFREVPPAPLKATISRFLLSWPDYEGNEWLRRVASLNQGNVDDLDENQFGSYVLHRTGLSAAQLLKCRLALRSYLATSPEAVGSSAELLMAARGTRGDQAPTADELFEQLRKRRL